MILTDIDTADMLAQCRIIIIIRLRTMLRDSFAIDDLTISFRCVFQFFKHVFVENMVSSEGHMASMEA